MGSVGSLEKGPGDGDTGIPLHKDNQTVVKERIYADKADRDVIHNVTTHCA
jgi:hypothetical protein